MARVFADHTDHVFALHDAAAFAKAFDGCSYFHVGSSVEKSWILGDEKTHSGKNPSAIHRRLAYFCRKVIRPLVKS